MFSISILCNNKSKLIKYYKIIMDEKKLKNAYLYTDPYKLLVEIEKIDCDLIFLDIGIKTMVITKFLTRLIQVRPRAQIVILAMDKTYALEAMQIGALDYVLKSLKKEDIQRIQRKLYRMRHKYA